MSEFDGKVVPIREDRLGAIIEFGGDVCQLKRSFCGGCLRGNDRGFSQGSICQLMPGLSMLGTIPETVVIVHGAIGCGGSGHSQSAGVRGRQILAGDKNPRGTLWLSTNLNERDVISGGEQKLEQAILEADRRYRPAAIIVVSTCVPGIIGDDIDGVVAKIQPQVSAPVLPVHCEGFKTKIMATAYDAVYHAISHHLLGSDEEQEPIIRDEYAELARTIRNSKRVNLLNVSSGTPGDDAELSRLIAALGLEPQVYPVFTHPDDMKFATEAALTVGTCPTHDDYFMKHLKEKYGIPYLLKYMPIGIESTNEWLREIARFFHLEEIAERVIEREKNDLEEALRDIKKNLKGKKAMLSAGEVRTLATARRLQELGMEVVAVRPYHFDEFGQPALDQLIAADPQLEVNVATVQPFETVNLIQKHKPDIYFGHNSDNVWAAKMGVPVLPIYGGPYTYVGYAGAFDLARNINRVLKNPSFNKNLSSNVRQPYFSSWFTEQPYQYIKQGGGFHEE